MAWNCSITTFMTCCDSSMVSLRNMLISFIFVHHYRKIQNTTRFYKNVIDSCKVYSKMFSSYPCVHWDLHHGFIWGVRVSVYLGTALGSSKSGQKYTISIKVYSRTYENWTKLIKSKGMCVLKMRIFAMNPRNWTLTNIFCNVTFYPTYGFHEV